MQVSMKEIYTYIKIDNYLSEFCEQVVEPHFESGDSTDCIYIEKTAADGVYEEEILYTVYIRVDGEDRNGNYMSYNITMPFEEFMDDTKWDPNAFVVDVNENHTTLTHTKLTGGK